MPRGEETQEIQPESQEGRDLTQETPEALEESQRLEQAAIEPEAVVELERPVEEAEAIEAAIVEAVEAVIEVQGLETEDGEVIEEMDETSFKVESQAVVVEEVLDEISYKTKPGEGTGEAAVNLDETSYKVESQAEVSEEVLADISYKTKPAEFTEGMDETSYKTESSTPESEMNVSPEAEVSDAILEGSDFKFFTPQPESELKEGSEAEVNDVILEGADFKFFTPQPEGDVVESETPLEQIDTEIEAEADEVILEGTDFKPVPAHTEAQEIEGEVGEEIDQVILEGTDFKPVPAIVEAEDIESEDPISEPLSEEGSAGEEPIEGNIEDGEEGQEEEGGSILIGDDGTEELEQIDLTEEASKEVEEYWEPPEMYIYTAEDGTQTFVDAEGNPIKCPPQFYLDKETGSETAKAWYPGESNVQAFDVPPFPGYKVDEFYIQVGKTDPVTGQPNYILVDRNGNPVDIQPEIKYDKNNDFFSYRGEGDLVSIPAKLFSESEIFIYTAADGSKTLVDSNGNPLKCPPKLIGDSEGGYSFKGPQGVNIQVNEYSSPTSDIYVYTAPDGTKTVVDSNGNPVKCPPSVSGNPEDGFATVGPQGEKIQLTAYVPQFGEIYVYTAQDGTKMVVDKNGSPVKYPPNIMSDPGGEGFITEDSTGTKIEVAAYQPPLTDIYVYTAQDGTKTVVDISGNPIKCPPPLFNAPEEGSLTAGSEGQKVKIPDFIPPTTDIYVYTAADGTKTVVDKYGDPVKSPPHTWNDPSGEGGTVINGPDGKPLSLKEYKPLSSHWDK